MSANVDVHLSVRVMMCTALSIISLAEFRVRFRCMCSRMVHAQVLKLSNWQQQAEPRLEYLTHIQKWMREHPGGGSSEEEAAETTAVGKKS
jgi:hypothetical protein